ncbi:hypothetical protein B296_00007669 [Ensete ventricosum]|uniref:Uncharacterized protein n=1 Tax=Ensete ventricosum TaxID=4639 RepID=A0A427B2E1_ENSVE|nr:hypothetical protein B296_00007669 [Ensete ventricosum]
MEISALSPVGFGVFHGGGPGLDLGLRFLWRGLLFPVFHGGGPGLDLGLRFLWRVLLVPSVRPSGGYHVILRWVSRFASKTPSHPAVVPIHR